MCARVCACPPLPHSPSPQGGCARTGTRAHACTYTYRQAGRHTSQEAHHCRGTCVPARLVWCAPEPVIRVVCQQLDDEVHALRGDVGHELDDAGALLRTQAWPSRAWGACRLCLSASVVQDRATARAHAQLCTFQPPRHRAA